MILHIILIIDSFRKSHPIHHQCFVLIQTDMAQEGETLEAVRAELLDKCEEHFEVLQKVVVVYCMSNPVVRSLVPTGPSILSSFTVQECTALYREGQ